MQPLLIFLVLTAVAGVNRERIGRGPVRGIVLFLSVMVTAALYSPRFL